jgi:ribosomal protein S18 acetylase RimI-like enzyme
LIVVRRARPADAPGIGVVHVDVWRTAYVGILPDSFLQGLSMRRMTAHYGDAIRGRETAVFVAIASGSDVQRGSPPHVVGFVTAGRGRQGGPNRIADGEIETLYVLDDYRDRGVGRALIRAAASALAESGCTSAYLWVLRDNPSRWFYRRLGGRAVADSTTHVAGQKVPQTAFLWDPITLLVQASPQDS